MRICMYVTEDVIEALVTPADAREESFSFVAARDLCCAQNI